MTPRDIVLEQVHHRQTFPVPFTLWFEGDVAERLDGHYGGTSWRERLTPYIVGAGSVDTMGKKPAGDGYERDADAAAEYGSGDEDEATPEQWSAAESLRAALPAATCTLRWHRVCRGGRTGLRWSVRVAVEWHGRTLTRDYAVPAGLCPDGTEAV